MTFPAIIFGIVLSTIFGTVFHFWKGGSLSKLIIFVVIGWIGFWCGHFAGAALHWNFAAAGPLNTGMASLGAIIFLLVGEWLSRVEISKK